MNKQFFTHHFVLWFIIIVFFHPAHLQSQPKKGMYGITTAISEGFEHSSDISTNSGPLNLGMAYLPSDHISIRCNLGFRSQKDTSGNKNSEFTFTGSIWYYLQSSKSISTFVGGDVGFGSATDVAGIGTSLVSISGFFGAEYWFSPHFSLFGHIGLVSASYKIAERPASDVFTSATTGITWYF